MSLGHRAPPPLTATSIPRTEASAIRYYVLGDQENLIDSRVPVRLEDPGKSKGPPQPDGVFDLHMGPTATGAANKCETCNLLWADDGQRRGPCPGHFGHVELRYPIPNTFFVDDAILWLQAICHSCGLPVANNVNTAKSAKNHWLRLYATEAKPSGKNAKCHNCGVLHPHVIMEEGSETSLKKRIYKASKETKDTTHSLDDLPTHTIRYILGRVTAATVEKLGRTQHPDKLTLMNFRVPPNPIRPSMRKYGSNKAEPDDLTMLVGKIVNIRNSLPEQKVWGEHESLGEDLTKQTTQMANFAFNMQRSSTKIGSGIRSGRDGDKKIRSITDRVKGKGGRIRRNLLGRRVWVIARSFITCDNSLALDEVGIPQMVAQEIQIEEVVREHNFDRCNFYYQNGVGQYPNVKRIIKKGGIVRDRKRTSEPLKIGDIILRDVVDGDIVGFNRQPSLLYCSVASFKAKVLAGVLTFRMNLQIVDFFNADFDGDAMIIIFATSARTRNEIHMLANSSQFFISYKDSKPIVGNAHDSLIGMATMTRNEVVMDKSHAMYLTGQIPLDWDFTDTKQVSGREMVSKLWKTMGLTFNYKGTPNFYDPKAHARTQYFPPEDTKIVVKNGELISGILDKSSIGGGARNGIYQIIHNQYNPDVALKLALYMQWLALAWIGTRGFTIHMGDIVISKEAKQEIDQEQTKIIAESQEITERLNAGSVVPPLGQTIDEYYESMQLNALKPNDAITEIIYRDTDLYNNNLSMDVFHGVRGNRNNIRLTNSALMQQSIHGERMKASFNGRCLIYFPRFDFDPQSRGYIANSYLSGLTPAEMMFHTQESRFALINRSQNTAQTGYQNRLASKSLEPCIIDNHRRVNNNGKFNQLVYGGDGVDPRYLESVRIPTFDETETVDDKEVPLTDARIREIWGSKTNMFKNVSSASVQKVLDAETDQLLKDRHEYMQVQLLLQHLLDKPYNSGISIPVNVLRILDTIISVTGREKSEVSSLNPVQVIEKVNKFCDELVFVLINEEQRQRYRNGEYAPPEHLRAATKMMQMVVRLFFSTRNLSNMGATMAHIELAMYEIERIYRRNLIAYGTCIGIIASQCISEPMTQTILDSHHSAGQGIGKKKDIERVKQILGVTEGKHPEDGSMTLHVLPELINSEQKVQEIANMIEMMRLTDFIENAQIFFEGFPKNSKDTDNGPTHPDYVHERGIITDFIRYNPAIKVPEDLSKWCFRIQLDKVNLIGKNMTVSTIYHKMKEMYPKSYIVYTQDNAEKVLLRVYMRAELIPKDENLNKMKLLLKNMLETVIRGVSGIRGAKIEEYKNHRVVGADGGLQKVKGWYIQTLGSNMRDILDLPFFDHKYTQTDRIVETYKIFGISAANIKLVSELMFQISGVNFRHYTGYSDEMTFTGVVTSINRYGTANRDMPVMLRASDASPMVVFKDAAIRGVRDEIQGVSPALMMSKNPKIGDQFNPFLVDEEFVKEESKEADDLL